MYGDDMGNKVLMTQANLIRKCVGEKVTYGRISGDRFGICIPKDYFVEKEFTDNIDEMKKEKYRFTKARERYRAEHEGELRRFYMVKRKLKEKGFEKETYITC